MTRTTARIKQAGKHFEMFVELEDAMKFKKGELASIESEDGRIYTDIKKGNVAPERDLEEAFGTSDATEIAKKIVKSGEVLTTQDFRDAEQEKRIKQAVDFLSRNAMNPQNGMPHSPERIERALEEAHVNIKNSPIENQISDIIAAISRIIPIRIEVKKVKITIPAIHTGKAYNVISQYKDEETWMNDGSLEVTVKVPAGMIMDFYDKLNSVTHGAAVTEEIKE